MSPPDDSPRPSAPSPWGLIEVVHDIDAVSAEWDDLADRAGADPFCRPGWFSAWMRAFTPEGRIGAVTLRGAGRLRAIVPLLRQGAVTRSPTNEHTPRFRILGEDASAVAELAAIVLRLHQRRLSLSPMDVTEGSLDALRAAGDAAGYRVVERVELRSPVVPLEGIEEADAVLDRKMRKELRRCRRRLDEAGVLEMAVNRGDDDLDGVLAEAFAVEDLQWKGEGGTAVTSSPQTHAFYLDVARWAARRGTLRLVNLRLDGQMIAFELDILDASGLYSLKAGFDPSQARFSPGHLVALAAITEGLAAGAPAYELLGDAEPYKMRWTDVTREMRSFEASPGTAAGTVEHLRLRYLRPARRRISRRAASLASFRRPDGR